MADGGPGLWLLALRRYLAASAIGHLVWESLQLPLYALWSEDSAGLIAFAVVHCTAGDILIALASLSAAIIFVGSPSWPSDRFREVARWTVLVGLAYTFYSEWFNVSVRESWAYAPSMPTLPFLGTGLTPILEWIVIPIIALTAARNIVVRASQPT